jgi:hypothetical protein
MKLEENDSLDLLFVEDLESSHKLEFIANRLKISGSGYTVETFLDDMLRFLAEMPVDEYHDYSIFRHSGLRGYLINRFLHSLESEK